MLDPQREFLIYLRFKRSLLACDEVSSYGCIADVLAVDKNKKHVLEYEFKNNSKDLKINELKKTKYGQRRGWKLICGKHQYLDHVEYQQPHRFYFVVPQELWEKEKDYLEGQKCGVIMYHVVNKKMEFLTMKTCKLRKKNLQKYEVAARDVLRRATSAYVNLLDTVGVMKELHLKQLNEVTK